MQFYMRRYEFFMHMFDFYELRIILRLVLWLHDLQFYFPFPILLKILILTTFSISSVLLITICGIIYMLSKSSM